MLQWSCIFHIDPGDRPSRTFKNMGVTKEEGAAEAAYDLRGKELQAFRRRQRMRKEQSEYEAARAVEDWSVMLVPTELVPEIRRLIGRRRGA